LFGKQTAPPAIAPAATPPQYLGSADEVFLAKLVADLAEGKRRDEISTREVLAHLDGLWTSGHERLAIEWMEKLLSVPAARPRSPARRSSTTSCAWATPIRRGARARRKRSPSPSACASASSPRARPDDARAPYGAGSSEQYDVASSAASASTATARCGHDSSSLQARQSAARPSAAAWLAQRW